MAAGDDQYVKYQLCSAWPFVLQLQPCAGHCLPTALRLVEAKRSVQIDAFTLWRKFLVIDHTSATGAAGQGQCRLWRTAWLTSCLA